MHLVTTAAWSQGLSSLQLPRLPPSPGVWLAEEHLSKSNILFKKLDSGFFKLVAIRL